MLSGLTILNSCLGVIAFLMAIQVCSGIHKLMVEQSNVNVNANVPMRHSDWPTIFTLQGAGNEAIPPVHVSNTWQLTWNCDQGDSLYMQVINAQDRIIWIANASGVSGDTSGFASVTYTGKVHMEVSSRGVWTVSIQEPQ